MIDTEYPRWFAVLTGPRAEQEAFVNLRRAGYRVFYPHVLEQVWLKRSRGKGIRGEVKRPLFQRYVFFALTSPEENFEAIQGMKGISAIVRCRYSKVPLQIPNAAITILMDWADSEGLCPMAKAAHWFRGKVGDQVEIKDGPLEGLITCISSLEALDDTDEIAIFVKMLGAEHQVTLPASSVNLIAAVPEKPKRATA